MKTDDEKKTLYQKLIAEEIANFITENKKIIVKRALKLPIPPKKFTKKLK